MEISWQDVRFAFRTLRKNLSVTVLAVTSLALAIAGNTAVYSLINSFLYRPIPYHDVERIELIGERNSDVLRGQLRPPECPELGRACTPEHPLGAPMVSAEGACAAYHAHRSAEAAGDAA